MSILGKGIALPELEGAGFTLSSYNVLLPNSSDGWWIYKYYQRHVEQEQRLWQHRSQLTKNNLIGSGGGADIVCVQETSADSFQEDFAFMTEAGYDSVLHSKFRFRTATFFRRDKFELKSEKHGDRTLTTLLGLKESGRSVFVVNCHLTGGPSPDKRMRQVHDATEYIRKEINKMQPSKPTAGKKGAKPPDGDADGAAAAPPPPPAVVICGDFNEDGETGVKKLLTAGLVPAGFSCEGITLTTKDKKQELGAFTDAHSAAYAAANRPRPPTLISANLDNHFLEPGPVVDDSAGAPAPVPTGKLLDALLKAWNMLVGNKEQLMSREQMEEWLIKINGQLGRGSEFRAAQGALDKKKEAGLEEALAFEDFVEVYMDELRQGKFWGVHHDLQQALACPVQAAGEGPAFQVVYDYIYSSPQLIVEAVREELTDDELARAVKGDDPLPNAWQPSDHVMQTAVFRFP